MGGVGSGGKPREYPAEVVELVCGMYRDGMTVAEIRAAAPKGYRVQTILERYLPDRRPAARRDQRGERNHMWKGHQVSYDGVHERLRSTRGKASAHACVGCGLSADDWSYRSGSPLERIDPNSGCAFAPDLSYYDPRCRSCHRQHDAAVRREKEVMPHV
jgi:hypothetical protein